MRERIMLNVPSGRSRILIGPSLEELPEKLGRTPAAIVTDRTVFRLYGRRFPRETAVHFVGSGERNKSLGTAFRLYRRFLDSGLDRSSWIVGIGGGIVCDLTGFVASTFLRGLPFALVPTTLVAQADASIGGKNGLNVRGYKNIVGLVRQPGLVLCDPTLLRSLPPTDVRCGFAEIIKTASVGDAALFRFLERNVPALLRLEAEATIRAVSSAVAVKVSIVRRDDRDRCDRLRLNFGHTVGHALEKILRWPHGLAVAAGMVVAARLSVNTNRLRSDEAHRLDRLLDAFGLPTRLPPEIDRDRIVEAVFHDKKRKGGAIDFVMLDKIGRASIEPIGWDEFREVLHDLR